MDIVYSVFASSVYANAELIVPEGTLAKYQACEGWKNFTNMKEAKDATAISDVQNGEHTIDIYSVNGQLVRKKASSTNGLKPGVYVVNGKKTVVY